LDETTQTEQAKTKKGDASIARTTFFRGFVTVHCSIQLIDVMAVVRTRNVIVPRSAVIFEKSSLPFVSVYFRLCRLTNAVAVRFSWSSAERE
jgi:hypothetical protein